MSHNIAKENKMGTMPEGRLVISMGVPLMLSNLVQALYNIVDSIFVSRLTTDELVLDAMGNPVSAGTDAISALGLAFPIQIIIFAIGMGTSVGVTSLVSRSLGEGNRSKANNTAMHGIILMALSYLICLFMGIFLAPMLIEGQGAEGRTLLYGSTYLRIVCCLSIAVYMEIMFERLLQSTGRSALSMIPQITGAVINMIMDPILIYGLLGAPKLGVAGAAYATVFGQSVATVLGIFLNRKLNHDLHISFREFKFDPHIVKGIYAVGAPSIALQAVGSVMNYAMNSILIDLNAAAVAVFTIYYKLQSFFFLPVFGLNNAVIPIVAYNFGAKKKSRMMKSIKWALLYSFLLLFVGFLAFELIPATLIRIFDTGDASLIELGVPALRIIGCHFLLAWFCIIMIGVFQAVGNGVYSMLCSIFRQLGALIPAAFILATLFGLPAVWWSFPIAEGVSLLMTLLFYRKIDKKVLSQLPDDQS